MDTDIVCERGIFNKTCPHGTRIHLEDAIYGRLDNTTCESMSSFLKNGSSCVGDRNASLIEARGYCKEQSCTIWADNNIFGDPCPHIFKYLNITWKCTGKNFNCSFLH